MLIMSAQCWRESFRPLDLSCPVSVCVSAESQAARVQRMLKIVLPNVPPVSPHCWGLWAVTPPLRWISNTGKGEDLETERPHPALGQGCGGPWYFLS